MIVNMVWEQSTERQGLKQKKDLPEGRPSSGRDLEKSLPLRGALGVTSQGGGGNAPSTKAPLRVIRTLVRANREEMHSRVLDSNPFPPSQEEFHGKTVHTVSVYKGMVMAQ